jgi:hypothetical protein
MPVLLKKTGENVCLPEDDRQECLSARERQAGMPVLLTQIGRLFFPGRIAEGIDRQDYDQADEVDGP